MATAVETPVTRLSIRLLGGFRAERAGKPLDFRRKKGQALLAYLALRPGVEHSREALAGLLWAGTTDEHARHNLRQTLFALRQALPIPLVLEGETIGLRDASVEVDVAAFERAVQQGTPDALHEAAALYHGELLEGFTTGEAPFDDWVAVERQRLRELALGALERLLASDVAAGPVERALATALRLLALDPLRESAHRTLMELYARQGRRTSALRQYQLCRDALQRELQAKPDVETERLYREIQDESLSGRAIEANVAKPNLTAPPESKPSIAVLPFANMSGDPQQDYFSDGITEDIITELSRFRSLFVVAPIVLGAAIALGARGRWAELVVLMAGMFVIIGMTDAIKDWTERPRPPDPLVEVSSYSFPSAHAAYATIYTWLAATLAFRSDAGITRRGMLIGAGLAVTAAIGLTRVYLRAHWLSDVTSGWALGFSAFAGAAAIALLVTHFRDNARPDEQSTERGRGAPAGARD